jgi:hypothetical protein
LYNFLCCLLVLTPTLFCYHFHFVLGDLKNACNTYIREMAIQPGTSSSIVIGGYDQNLNFLDLNKRDSPYVQRLDMQGAISSVKWCPFNNSK